MNTLDKREIRQNIGRNRITRNTSCCICHRPLDGNEYMLRTVKTATQAGASYFYYHRHCAENALPLVTRLQKENTMLREHLAGIVGRNGYHPVKSAAEAIRLARLALDCTITPVPHDWPVQPLTYNQNATARATCGTCGLSWDDDQITSMTPTPSGRCPFESFHVGE